MHADVFVSLSLFRLADLHPAYVRRSVKRQVHLGQYLQNRAVHNCTCMYTDAMRWSESMAQPLYRS